MAAMLCLKTRAGVFLPLTPDIANTVKDEEGLYIRADSEDELYKVKYIASGNTRTGTEKVFYTVSEEDRKHLYGLLWARSEWGFEEFGDPMFISMSQGKEKQNYSLTTKVNPKPEPVKAEPPARDKATPAEHIKAGPKAPVKPAPKAPDRPAPKAPEKPALSESPQPTWQDLHRENAALKKYVAELEAQASELANAPKIDTSEKDRLDEAIAGLMKQQSDLEGNLAKILKDCKAAEERKTTLDSQVNALQAKQQKLSRALSDELEATRKIEAQIRAELEGLQASIRGLKDEAKRLKDEKPGLEQALEASRALRDGLNKELEEAGLKEAELTARLERENQKQQELKAQIQERIGSFNAQELEEMENQLRTKLLELFPENEVMNHKLAFDRIFAQIISRNRDQGSDYKQDPDYLEAVGLKQKLEDFYLKMAELRNRYSKVIKTEDHNV